MTRIRDHLSSLSGNYVFTIIKEKKTALNSPSLIDLGIGDISRPLRPLIADAISRATHEMTQTETMRGYGLEAGYPFLREAIVNRYYAKQAITSDEIIVTDGIAPAIAFLPLLFSSNSRIALQSPGYPAYEAMLQLQGIEGDQIEWLTCNEANHFTPPLPDKPVDLIYLCSPHNPTGVALNRTQLKNWVDYARANRAIILFDAAYQGFISSPDIPSTIYEIEGADEVAIEFMSLSKSAGFTGLRCGHFVCPDKLTVQGVDGDVKLLYIIKHGRNVSSNGLPYPIQKGAEAALSDEGYAATAQDCNLYMESTSILKGGLDQMGMQTWGGVDCPYIWWKVPMGEASITFFEKLMRDYQLICVPGKGFGDAGEGYVRLSGFITPERAGAALKCLEPLGAICT